MKNNKIHSLILRESNIVKWLSESNFLEEELSINEDFIIRLLNTRFIIPLYKESFISYNDSTGDATPVMFFKSDYTPFVPVYTSLSKAKIALKTKNIVSNNYYKDLIYRSLCPFDLIDIIENNDIYEINLNPNEWCVSQLHLKKERVSSWKKILLNSLEKYSKEAIQEITFDDLLVDNIEIIKESKFINKCFVEMYKLEKNIIRYTYYIFSDEDPFYMFNEYADLISILNEINNKNNRDVFIEIIGHFEKDIKDVDLTKAIQIKNSNIKNQD